MTPVDLLDIVEDAHLVLDDGAWPNFHDAELHDLKLWRGDIRPDDDVWIGPVIEASFELCALREPYVAVLKFHDCVSIRLQAFNRDAAVYDLEFHHEARGHFADGTPLPPFIRVRFLEAFGATLSFACMRVQAVARATAGRAPPRPYI